MEPRIIDGKYQILRELGKGGMGIVYEARNLETSRRVAVKVIVSALLAKGSDATARFKREAKATSAIETQHVAQVLDAGRDPETGDPYIVMELLSGEDLKQLIERLGPLPPDLALRIVAQACVGLQVAHDAGITHRDIKSANLFLARRDGGEITLKIVDFGIAKVVVDHASGGQSAELTHTGSVLGSPRYISPEQGKGQRDLSHRSDLWSLGVVLYEMLAGATPHAEIDGIYAIVMAICTEPQPPLQQRAPWVSPELAAIVHRALQTDPQKRFASATKMLEAIRTLLPDAMTINESMLAPITEEMKQRVSAVLIHNGDVSSSSEGAVLGSPTVLNVSQGVAGSRVSPRRSLILAASASSILLIGGLVATTLAGRRAPPPQGSGVVGALVLSASAAPSGSAPVVMPPPPPETRSVRVAVDPADAIVEVDGRATPVKDGTVELRGEVGSVHQVRVARGAQEAVTGVAITYLGAVPTTVRIEAALPKGPLKHPGAAAAALSRPSAIKAAPASTPNDPPPATKFE